MLECLRRMASRCPDALLQFWVIMLRYELPYQDDQKD